MLVAQLFAWLDRVLGGRAAPLEPGIAASRGGVSARQRQGRSSLANAALLSVDGAGQFLLCGADRLTLGHLRAGKADLGFLADVGSLHAELLRTESLQLGPAWRLAPFPGERVRVDGRDVGPAGARLGGGECVRLGENLEFRTEAPDPASASLVLEFLHGAECGGARRVILMAPGEGGRVRLGATLAHHVRVPGLELEFTLEWSAGELRVHSELALEGAPEEKPERLRSVPFPPPARVAFQAEKAQGSRPPFGFSLEPVRRA